jgi:hypothetical protein
VPGPGPAVPPSIGPRTPLWRYPLTHINQSPIPEEILAPIRRLPEKFLKNS